MQSVVFLETPVFTRRIWIAARSRIYMLLAYAKNERDDLSQEQIKVLRALVRQEFG